MAKKAKVETEEKEQVNIDEVINKLIDMETTELKTILSLRNTLTQLCQNKKNTLIILGKMAGLETSLLESLKVD